MVNLPNSLTLLRVLLVPVFVILMIDGKTDAALFVFVIAAITDGLDGFMARVLDQKTTLGAYLDPVADKTLVTTAYVVLTLEDLIPSWLTVIVISRDIIIVVGFMILFLIKGRGIQIGPSMISKVTTLFQLVTVMLALFFLQSPYIALAFFLTAILTILSGLDYIFKGFRTIET